MNALVCCMALLAGSDEPFLTWVVEPVGAAALAESRGERLSPRELAGLANSGPPLPFDDLTVGVRGADGATWVGSRRGLMLLAPGAARWRLFHSRRWLPADEVEALAINEASDVLVDTTEGVVKLSQRPTTLVAKMKAINDTLVAHHVREGLVGAIDLNEPGDLTSGHSQHSNDNDGLWTSMYVAAEAFRFGATGDAAAKTNARRSLDALFFLEKVTGIAGFAARSIVPGTEPMPTHGEWHRSADDQWWWKGDTSSDEIVGHYFAYAVYYNIAADETEKEELRGLVGRMTDHILDHDLHYVGPPGVPTRWGVWAPEQLNHDLRWLGDRGLNSLEILSHLEVAQHVVAKPRYAETTSELVTKHAYAANTVFQKHAWPVERVNHSDDKLAFLSYYPLLVLERDEELRKFYLASIRRTWFAERAERSPLFNLIYGAALQASEWTEPAKRPDAALVDPEEYDREACVAWFRDVPADTTSWRVINSGRGDLGPLATNRFGRLTSGIVLPVYERAVMKWNGDPYTLDAGSDGRHRDDGTAILLPYWMGRYHRLID